MENYKGVHPFVKSEPELLQRPPAFDAFSVAGVCVEQLDATYQQILKALEALLNETFDRVVHEIVMEGKHCFIQVAPKLREVLCGIPGTKIEGPEMIMRPNATPEQIRELGPRENMLCGCCHNYLWKCKCAPLPGYNEENKS